MDESEVLCASEAGVLRSADAGATWTLLGGLADTGSRYFALAAAADSSVVFAAYLRGLYVGRYGDRYELAVPPAEFTRRVRALAFASEDGATLLAGGDSESFLGSGALYRVDTDPVSQKRSFNDLTANVPASPVSVDDLAYDPDREETYVGLYGGGVYRSGDQGSSWIDWSEGLSAPRIERLALRPGSPARIYAATFAKGVWARNADDSVPTLISGWSVSRAEDGRVRIRVELSRTLRLQIERRDPEGHPIVIFDRSPVERADLEDLPKPAMDLPTGDRRVRYRLRVAEPGSDLWLASAETAVEPRTLSIALSRLLPNLPNPFNPRTLLRWEIARSGHTRISIHDSRGRWVREVVDEPLAPGRYQWAWDGDDAQGRAVASGVYHVRMQHQGRRSARAITLLR